MFSKEQLWHTNINLTAEGFISRSVSAKFMDPQSLADLLRSLARQVERECGLRPAAGVSSESPDDD